MKLKNITLLTTFFLLSIATLVFGKFDYSTDFNSIDKQFFLVYDHGGYYQTPTTQDYSLVTIENGILKMPVNKTDHGPELITKGIKITNNSIITVEWKAKVHYANQYFAGGVNFWLLPYESFYDPIKGDKIRPFAYWDNTQEKEQYFGIAGVKYYNYYYGSGTPPNYGNSFGICGYKKCITSSPIWDKWFTNKVEINLLEKNVKFWQDGEFIGEVPLNPNIDLNKTPYLKIHFSPYGWYTGHEMDLDWLKIDITENSSSATTSCDTNNCATFDLTTMNLIVPCLSYNGKTYKLKLLLVQTQPQTLFALKEITETGNNSDINNSEETSELKEVTLSTTGNFQISFLTGELGSQTNYLENDDISVEPWCTEKPGLCGNFIDLGDIDINSNIQIPTSGYLSDKAGYEDCIEVDPNHTFINKNKDGSYTVFKIIKHEKPSECDHTLIIEYKNLK